MNNSDAQFLGAVLFESNFTFADTEVGGLSGLVYDAEHERYYAVSDDSSTVSAARFYGMRIDLEDGSLDAGDITFTGITTLLNAEGQPFAPGSIAPEGIAFSANGRFFIVSEGDTSQQLSPFVYEFSITGERLRELPIPSKFWPTADQSSGIRNDLAFKSLTLSPDSRFLYTATENALLQDGPTADLFTLQSPSRILRYDLANLAIGASTETPGTEFLYFVDGVGPVDDIETTEAESDVNFAYGLVELLALPEPGKLLALERSLYDRDAVNSDGSFRIYEVDTTDATDISQIESLLNHSDPITPVSKQLVLDSTQLQLSFEANNEVFHESDQSSDHRLDNFEALSYGPLLPDGRQSFILLSDNGLNAEGGRQTQFLAFAIAPQPDNLVPTEGATGALLLGSDAAEQLLEGNKTDIIDSNGSDGGTDGMDSHLGFEQVYLGSQENTTMALNYCGGDDLIANVIANFQSGENRLKGLAASGSTLQTHRQHGQGW